MARKATGGYPEPEGKRDPDSVKVRTGGVRTTDVLPGQKGEITPRWQLHKK